MTNPQDVEYGFWSVKKLIAINYLIPKFGDLASKGGLTNCFYLDVLAGSGITRVEKEILPGSAIVALASETTAPHFRRYYFIEKDLAKANLLRSRLARVAADRGNREFEVRSGDCNKILPEVLDHIYREGSESSCFLALFDPEGYSETSWSTVQMLLGRGRGDLIFNFTEGVARNVQKAKSDATYIPALHEYFGERSDAWLHLEGYESLVEHYVQRLLVVNGMKRIVSRIDVRDDKNRPLYALLIATGSTGVANIIQTLKKRLDPIRVRDIEAIHAELSGKSKPLYHYD
jgi:three-Cys-motif partner protein